MIIFSEHITTRLTYILNYVFKTKFELPYELTKDADVFVKSDDFKINYSNLQFDDAYQIVPEGLLFENNIRTEYPILSYINDLPIVFSQNSGNIQFDIFSALFWFLSRYEEYMPFEPDNHGRFAATQSFAYKNDILNRPIIDEWMNYFRKELENLFTGIVINHSKFNALTTIDVDSPWCYKNKGFLRNTAGIIRDILHLNLSNVLLRFKVLTNITTDPWYKFKWLLDIHNNTKTKLMFFVHVGDYGKYDKTVNYKLKAFMSFINSIGSQAKIALHPSYKASSNINIFKDELNRLSELTGEKIIISRQHFLVFALPSYYQMLIELGIQNDYSMGFADKSGFRAGTSGSFHFFDLEINRETNLNIHPFAIMDRTLNSYEGNNPDKAIATVNELIDNVKKVDGTFVSLWHNESLSNLFEWRGWLRVFKEYYNNISG